MLELLLKYSKYLTTLLCLGFSLSSYGGLLLNQSRVVMDDAQPERVMYVVNTNDYPVLMQTWVTDENSDALPDETTSPFVVLPPVAKLQPGEKKRLNIYYSGQALTTSAEQLYLLNLHEVPPAPDNDENKIIVSMTTQIKLFLRPSKLKDQSFTSIKEVYCQKQKNGEVKIVNESPFYFNYLKINGLDHSGYLPPFTHKNFQLNDVEKLEILYLQDLGTTQILPLSCQVEG